MPVEGNSICRLNSPSLVSSSSPSVLQNRAARSASRGANPSAIGRKSFCDRKSPVRRSGNWRVCGTDRAWSARAASPIAVHRNPVQRFQQRRRRLTFSPFKRDATIGNHPFDLAPRGDPCAGQKLGDAFLAILAFKRAFGGRGIRTRLARGLCYPSATGAALPDGQRGGRRSAGVWGAVPCRAPLVSAGIAKVKVIGHSGKWR
jgi:hypothetical protein